MEEFSYYIDAFHDGSILKMTKEKDDFSIEMESTEIYLCENKYHFPLSSRNTLYGILHLKNVKLIENEHFSFHAEYDCGHIMDMDVTDHLVSLSGYWVGYGKKALKEEVWFKIAAHAERIEWENTADTKDPSFLGTCMGLPGRPLYGHQGE